MSSFLQTAIFLFKASDVQIVEMMKNRRENKDAVDIVGRFGYYKQVWLLLIGFGYSEAGLVTPGRVWLLLGRTKGKNEKQRSKK